MEEVYVKHYTIKLYDEQYDQILQKIQDGDLTTEEYLSDYLRDNGEVSSYSERDYDENLKDAVELKLMFRNAKQLPYGNFK